jgi:hypothetical protein
MLGFRIPGLEVAIQTASAVRFIPLVSHLAVLQAV